MTVRLAGAMRRVVAGAVFGLLSSAAPTLAGELAVVANHVIYPGQIIKENALREVPLVRGNRNLGEIFQEAPLLYGKVARRTILPGRLIRTSSVRDAYLVETGSPVKVVLIDGNMVISATAVPLESGAAGDVVRLRNIDSGRTFSGIVLADGSVRVGAS